MTISALAYISAAAGFVIVLGSLILLFKRTVVVDSNTRDVLAIELPFLGRLRTNTPVIAILAIGVILLLYPLYLGPTEYQTTKYVDVYQAVTSTAHPVIVYAVFHRSELVDDSTPLHLKIPKVDDALYQPQLLYEAGQVSKPLDIDLTDADTHGRLNLPTFKLEPTPSTIGNSGTPGSLVQPTVAAPPEGFQNK